MYFMPIAYLHNKLGASNPYLIDEKTATQSHDWLGVPQLRLW